MDTPFLDATALAAAIRNRDISSREALAAYLSRIDSHNGAVNAVVTLDIDTATRDAEAADQEAARNSWRGPLHGVPVTIKDAIATKGLRTTGGAVELADNVPVQDAPVVSALRNAGAIVFGKTNLPRWSADLQAFNDLFGTTRNPWSADRTSGGSSGGAAAAVACGFTAFEIGTDIGGSIRMPAHFCGIYGLKPTFGLVPQRGYVDHPEGGTVDVDINVFGPLARSARDLDLVLRIIAGPDPEREPAWSVDIPAPRVGGVEGLRVATWFEDADHPTSSEVLGPLQHAAGALEQAGAKVAEASPPIRPDDQYDLFMRMIGAATAPSMDPKIAEMVAGSHLQWLADERTRAGLRQVWTEWFESFDVLLCPVAVRAAIAHDHSGDITTRRIVVDGSDRPYLDLIRWTGIIGITGFPSAVVPVGRTPDGLPVGVQVVAPMWRDLDCVAVAGLLGDLTLGFVEPPLP